jgi:uncharacterized protein YndB with AHSA1/START domain
MATTKPGSETVLVLTRTFAAPREKVFRAWTDPALLKKWWAAGPGFTPTVAEIDLRVGGRYRLGMRAPDADADYVVAGTYREVQRPARLVYTWAWEGAGAPETLVTVEFLDRGAQTEVILTHEQFADASDRDQHASGWSGCLDNLARVLTASDT